MNDHLSISKDLFQKTKSEHLLLAQTIERLLLVRRKELDRGVSRLLQVQKRWSREWTRAELMDVAYSSYRALLNGKLKNFPSRNQILTIGDYLACTPLEINSLLVAAGYTPLREPINHEQAEEILRITQKLMTTLPMPAIVMAYDWTILGVNPATIEFFGLHATHVHTFLRHSVNLLELIFDDSFPLMDYIHSDSRDILAYQSIQRFRMNNILYQHERWYNEVRDRLWRFPRFATLWRAADEQTALQAPDAPTPLRMWRSKTNVEEVFMVQLCTGIQTTPSPYVLTLIPRTYACVDPLRHDD